MKAKDTLPKTDGKKLVKELLSKKISKKVKGSSVATGNGYSGGIS